MRSAFHKGRHSEFTVFSWDVVCPYPPWYCVLSTNLTGSIFSVDATRAIAHNPHRRVYMVIGPLDSACSAMQFKRSWELRLTKNAPHLQMAACIDIANRMECACWFNQHMFIATEQSSTTSQPQAAPHSLEKANRKCDWRAT